MSELRFKSHWRVVVLKTSLPRSQTANATLLLWAVTSIGSIVMTGRSTELTKLSFCFLIQRVLLAIKMRCVCSFALIVAWLMKQSWVITLIAGKLRSCSSSKKEPERNPDFRARRWAVEVTHSFFNRFRKLLVRYEKKATNYLTLVQNARGDST